MGAKSTLDMDREEAIARILELLRRAEDQTIASVLEELNDDADRRGDYEHCLGLHNFRIR